jgi:hypothetical protein
VSISSEKKLIPPRIQEALTDSALLFVGYQIADWDLRVILRGISSYFGKRQRTSISVQLLPGNGSDKNNEKIKEYLDKYFKELDIRVYWGDCREFSAELKRRWEVYNFDM